jgi:hypothetical protein
MTRMLAVQNHEVGTDVARATLAPLCELLASATSGEHQAISLPPQVFRLSVWG